MTTNGTLLHETEAALVVWVRNAFSQLFRNQMLINLLVGQFFPFAQSCGLPRGDE